MHERKELSHPPFVKICKFSTKEAKTLSLYVLGHFDDLCYKYTHFSLLTKTSILRNDNGVGLEMNRPFGRVWLPRMFTRRIIRIEPSISSPPRFRCARDISRLLAAAPSPREGVSGWGNSFEPLVHENACFGVRKTELAPRTRNRPFRHRSLTFPSLVRKYLGDWGQLSPFCALCRRWSPTKMQTGDTTLLHLGRYSD